jgi:hypothetical protein
MNISFSTLCACKLAGLQVAGPGGCGECWGHTAVDDHIVLSQFYKIRSTVSFYRLTRYMHPNTIPHDDVKQTVFLVHIHWGHGTLMQHSLFEFKIFVGSKRMGFAKRLHSNLQFGYSNVLHVTSPHCGTGRSAPTRPSLSIKIYSTFVLHKS